MAIKADVIIVRDPLKVPEHVTPIAIVTLRHKIKLISPKPQPCNVILNFGTMFFCRKLEAT